jgi:biotin carboxyl carrier protein
VPPHPTTALRLLFPLSIHGEGWIRWRRRGEGEKSNTTGATNIYKFAIMIKATVNGKQEFTIDGKNVNGEAVEWDLIEVHNNTFHILVNNKGYNATLVSHNPEEKTMVINVNGNDYEIAVKDKYDLLLQQLGISAKSSAAVNNIKAPMPGLIISITAQAGDEVKKGDGLLILEAMKMENVIKSPRDGKVKKVNVQLRQPVEKNQVMIEFE